MQGSDYKKQKEEHLQNHREKHLAIWIGGMESDIDGEEKVTSRGNGRFMTIVQNLKKTKSKK